MKRSYISINSSGWLCVTNYNDYIVRIVAITDPKQLKVTLYKDLSNNSDDRE